MTRTTPVRTGSARRGRARPGLARAAVLALAVACPRAAGVLTAGPAPGVAPASVVADLPPTSQAGLNAVVMTDPLGRKLK